MGIGGFRSLAVPMLIICTITSVLVAVIRADAALSVPTASKDNLSHCSGDIDAFDAVACPFQVLGLILTFIFDAVTFNVPDAPWWIRVPFGTLNVIGLVAGIIGLVLG